MQKPILYNDKHLNTAFECFKKSLTAKQKSNLCRAMMFNGEDHAKLMKVINKGGK